MKLEIYTDTADLYRWRLIAKNGEIVADSSESYTRLADLNQTLDLIWGDSLVREFIGKEENG